MTIIGTYVRYFLGVAEELSFSRTVERCAVARH